MKTSQKRVVKSNYMIDRKRYLYKTFMSVLAIGTYLMPISTFCQTIQPRIEQYALDYLASEIHAQESKARVFKYDGRITRRSTNLESVAGLGYDFFHCKHSQDRERPDSLKTSAYWLKKAGQWYDYVKTQPFDTTDRVSAIHLFIPKEFKAVDNLTHKHSSYGFIRKLVSKFRRYSYNMRVLEAVELEEHFLVSIDEAGKSGTGGRFYYFLLDKQGKVLDWCMSSYIV
ncbi:hypothetical protein GU926_11890 [Nibribacter ruber]|uniref:Uncharacterized protein n=1 Tax=Nibribacter ruber TaxID=2698458 RepID=A0A6P1NZW8_9BACT|nr:hypothetical protein [Nibribacter ruber]QHL88094.1 hypothetical protein GU926_11890 [Nibribacter ruber]